ncbi:MAG: cache domain-containing protein [Pseudomonadota bacterium]
MQLFRHQRLQYKLLAIYLTLFIVAIFAGSLTIYSFVRNTIQANIESELQNSTNTIFNLVRTSVSVSIKNHLRAVAEKNKEIAAHYYHQFQQGLLSESQAQQMAGDIMLSQTIGKSGYLYCLNSRGTVTVHPRDQVLASDVSGFQFVQEMMQRKEGYMEYQWKNPGEEETRPKALYMSYFKPWDWIISASSYRKEFADLINVDDFRASILSLKFGNTGYSYVTDGAGNTIIHPKMEGINIFKQENIPSMFFKDMLKLKSGKIIYSWKNPDELDFREKLVVFNYIPEFDWIVASSSYLDEVYAPLTTVKTIIFLTACITILLAVPVTLRISSSITTPLRELTSHLEASGASGDFTARIHTTSTDEIGIVTTYFNTFMERLERYSTNLKQEINERKEAEKALRGSEERYREALGIGDKIRRKIGQDLHDDLCPHLIGIEGFCAVLKKRLESLAPDEVNKIERIRKLIAEATDKARKLSRGLCPAHLVASGLESALRDLCKNVEEFSRVACTLDCHTSLSIPEERAADLYYIIQEAVYNAIKHGKPEKIRITITLQDGCRVITVDDNGSGMPEATDSMGIGMRIMAHRARQINCFIAWQNRETGGTRVTITLDGTVSAAGPAPALQGDLS